MGDVIIWALLTGIITGGTWVAIVLRGKQRRLSERQEALLEETNRRLDEMDQTHERLAEVEERLEFAERLLAERKEPRELAPPP